MSKVVVFFDLSDKLTDAEKQQLLGLLPKYKGNEKNQELE